MQSVLVTGASGFIGRALVAALAGSGCQVIAAVRDRRNARFAGNVRLVHLPDLAQPVDWAPLLENVTHVVHLAAIAHRGAAVRDEVYERVNRTAVAQLASAVAKSPVQRLIFVSSIGAQSGPASEHVLTETDAPRPTAVYGRMKLAAEADLRASGAPHTILRPVLTYGRGAPGNMASLVRLAALPVLLPFGALDGRRSLLAIDNLVAAIRFALDERKTAGETYIVADPDPLTLPQIVTELRAAMNRSPGLFRFPPRLFAGALRMMGRAELWRQLGGSLIASPAKLVAAGWRPVVTTRDGLAAMVKHQD